MRTACFPTTWDIPANSVDIDAIVVRHGRLRAGLALAEGPAEVLPRFLDEAVQVSTPALAEVDVTRVAPVRVANRAGQTV